MSRRTIRQESESTMEDNLEHLITTFYDNKTEADKYKKVADGFNKEIKSFMIDNNLDEFKGENLQASVSIAPKEDFNELRAIEILRETLDDDLFNQVVKSKEYIDNDIMEQLAYTNKIDLSILSSCVTPKEPVITLRVKKVKK